MSVGDWLIFAGFICLSLVMAFQDIRTQKVSRALSLLLLGIEITVGLVEKLETEAQIEVIVTTAVALLIFYLVRLISGRLDDGRRKLGLADVFYSGAIGAYLGYRGWLIACFTACFLVLATFFFRTRQASIAFIPYLATGAVIARLVLMFL